MENKVIGVRFSKAGRIYYFDPDNTETPVGHGVIVETVRGIEYGKVVLGPRQVSDFGVPIKKIIRLATPEDELHLEQNREQEKNAYKICLDKIAAHGLPMKLSGVEQTFDGNKIIFYFTADGRIDFRELVKDLAAIFRTRIELRQIGVRDEAKMLGGIGCCGRALCCNTWLADFASVSIRMAKEQNISLNPGKISGICGRLMCCLNYENDMYIEEKENLPEIGSLTRTPQGEGRIISVNIFKHTVTVEHRESRAAKEYELSDVELLGGKIADDDPALEEYYATGRRENSRPNKRPNKN